MDGEEKSEQPTSEYGDQNPSRSNLTGGKEGDTEAKPQKKNSENNSPVNAEAAHNKQEGKPETGEEKSNHGEERAAESIEKTQQTRANSKETRPQERWKDKREERRRRDSGGKR